MAKKVILKQLVLKSNEDGDFTKGTVQYQLKVGGTIQPKFYTMSTVDWFESADLKKILKKAKDNIAVGLTNANP